MDKYINIDDLIFRIKQNIPSEKLTQTDLYVWIDEAIRKLEMPELMDARFDPMDVKSFRLVLPYGSSGIFSVLYNAGKRIEVCSADECENRCRKIESNDDEEQIPVCEDENAVYLCALHKENVWDRAIWLDDYFRNLDFVIPVFNAKERINGHLLKHGKSGTRLLEYIVDGNTLKFNFESGQVLIGYAMLPTDEDGMLLVPNIKNIVQYITHFVMYKLAEKLLWSGDASYAKMVEYYSNKYEMDLGRIKQEMKMPDPNSGMYRIIQRFYTLIPTYQNYSA